MSVQIVNRSGRCLVFVLAHAHYCAARETCACAIVGERKPRRVATSLTLPSGATLMKVERAVLAVPDVERAHASGLIDIEGSGETMVREGTGDEGLAEGTPARAGRKKRGFE